jgi:ABC-type transporter Mla subunit MlaD
MYAWVWGRLPGPVWVRAVLSLLLLAAVVVLLFTVVFPWAQSAIPFLQVTVDESSASGLLADSWR